MLTREEFGRLFDVFERSAWRLEIQGVYDEPEEREPFRRFLAGEPDDLEWMQDWYDWIHEVTSAGKQCARVRATTDPLTDYLRWELGVLTPPAVDAGEDIRVLPAQQAIALELPRTDFWLFDDSSVAVLVFGESGVVGAELVDEREAVESYRRVRDRAWDAAVPYQDWAATSAP
ncbi:DUF6879 family protein [Kibdelosporangium lantanae]|uniref:DUF6879 family protein n=1 Tax=Kibdelosporangium lantanae TaxID=1497396 RepID=A0ABW3M0P0_9PSEU